MIKKKSLSSGLIITLGILVLVFLYFPVAVVFIYSFNSDTINSFPMGGFSFKWYGSLFQNRELMTSLLNSLKVALAGTAIAVIVGVPAAYGMHRVHFPGKQLLNRIVILPMMLPGVITGIAILAFIQEAGIRQGMGAVILGHATFLLGTVLPQVYTRLRQLDKSLEEAATDLGATEVQTFFQVVLPNIKTSIIGAALLSVTLSMDEIPVTYFLNGTFTTLPIKILGMTRNNFSPEVNAICSIILILSVAAIVASVAMNKKEV